MSKLNDVFNKLGDKALNSELLQRHAAVLTRSGYRPAMSLNNVNHYTECHYSVDKPSMHAEKVALTKFRRYYQSRDSNDAKIRRKLKKTSMLIARVNQSSETDKHIFRNSAPCYHCLALIKDYGVRKVVFSTDYGEPQCQKGESIK